MLHPLLTATQDGTYVGTEDIGAMPFQGIIVAHSNESKWESFKANRNNEAFLDRICVAKVPYCLRVTEERMVYDKLIQNSQLGTASCAPDTPEMMARVSVLTRRKTHENSSLYSITRVYDGESLKDTDPKRERFKNTRMPRALRKAWTESRLDSPTRSFLKPSTSIRMKSLLIPCI